MATFTVTAERGSSSPVWVLECAQVGAVSQTKRLDHAAEEMREAIAYQAKIDPAEVEIIIKPILPSAVAELKTHADLLKQQAEETKKEASDAHHKLASEMKKQGFSVREIGIILGVSYQRAAQLAAR
ncbi:MULTISPECIES: hypothetical protein [unclassified Corynebacterium]|uniref:hypothetical protein n=1 Tax=unclassified Corynebacterium TaxID=2624378 RepID=UPI001FEE3F9D|nr:MULTISPECIES: hypothetical protein [unclassified Corynebacterium]